MTCAHYAAACRCEAPPVYIRGTCDQPTCAKHAPEHTVGPLKPIPQPQAEPAR